MRLVQLVCPHVRLIQFPNPQVAPHRRLALDRQMLAPVLLALLPQPFLLALVQLLLALSARESSR